MTILTQLDIEIFANKALIKINDEIINDALVNNIKEVIALKNLEDKKIAFDMSCVKTVNSRLFLENLLNNEFKMFNLQSEILAYFYMVLKNNFLNIYLSKKDFLLNKREFIKRNFLIVN